MAKTILLSCFFVVAVFGQNEDCDIRTAEQCAIHLQTQYDEAYMEYEAQAVHNSSQTLSDLCLSVLRGSKTTKCFDDNTKGCFEEDSKYIKTQWEETRRDILRFCNDTMCENFETLNDCKKGIYELGMKNGQVKRFCRTFNESFTCAKQILEDTCFFNIAFYDSLVERSLTVYYGRACTSGCGNLDPTIAAINVCWFHNKKHSLDDCSRHSNFKTCLLEKTNICPEIGKLLPQNIKYDHFEITCTTTSTTTTTTLQETTTTTMTTELPETTATTKTILPETTTMTTTHSRTTIQKSTLLATKESLALEDLSNTTTVIVGTNSTSTSGTSSSYQNQNNTTAASTLTVTDMTKVFTTAKDAAIVDHIKECIPVSLKHSSSWNTSKLDFSKCMSIQMTVVCINSNIGSQEDTTNLLPRHVHSFLKDGSYKECVKIINGFSSYFRRVESACTPHIDTGCTGHSYGLLDCRSDASPTTTLGPILTGILILLR